MVFRTGIVQLFCVEDMGTKYAQGVTLFPEQSLLVVLELRGDGVVSESERIADIDGKVRSLENVGWPVDLDTFGFEFASDCGGIDLDSGGGDRSQ